MAANTKNGNKNFVHNLDVSLKCYYVNIFTSKLSLSHYRAKLKVFFVMDSKEAIKSF